MSIRFTKTFFRQIIAAGGTIVQANGDEVKPLKE